MVSIIEAIKIAVERNDKVDAYQEYADAYEFFVDDEIEREGGADNSFIVEKKTGQVLRWADYFMDLDRNIVEIGKPKKLNDVL